MVTSYVVTISFGGETIAKFIETNVDEALSLRDCYRLAGFNTKVERKG